MFILANSVDPDEMPHLCGISSGSSLFAKLPVLGFVLGVSGPQRVKPGTGTSGLADKDAEKTISGTIT